MVKKIIAISALLCAFILTAAAGKPVVLRPLLEPVSTEPEVVIKANTKPSEASEVDLWAEFTVYMRISLEEAENDGRGAAVGSEEPGAGADDIGLAEDDPGVAETSDGVYEADPEGAEYYPEEPEGTDEGTEEDSGEALIYVGDWTVTFYCQCEACCGRWAWSNSTASGAAPEAGWTVAAGESFTFGTILYIDGFGYYEVQDRGVPDGWVDIYVNGHSEIPGYGMTTASVYIVQ